MATILLLITLIITAAFLHAYKRKQNAENIILYYKENEKFPHPSGQMGTYSTGSRDSDADSGRGESIYAQLRY